MLYRLVFVNDKSYIHSTVLCTRYSFYIAICNKGRTGANALYRSFKGSNNIADVIRIERIATVGPGLAGAALL